MQKCKCKSVPVRWVISWMCVFLSADLRTVWGWRTNFRLLHCCRGKIKSCSNFSELTFEKRSWRILLNFWNHFRNFFWLRDDPFLSVPTFKDAEMKPGNKSEKWESVHRSLQSPDASGAAAHPGVYLTHIHHKQQRGGYRMWHQLSASVHTKTSCCFTPKFSRPDSQLLNDPPALWTWKTNSASSWRDSKIQWYKSENHRRWNEAFDWVLHFRVKVKQRRHQKTRKLKLDFYLFICGATSDPDRPPGTETCLCASTSFSERRRSNTNESRKCSWAENVGVADLNPSTQQRFRACQHSTSVNEFDKLWNIDTTFK